MRLKLVWKSKLNGRNNASVLRYRVGVLKWTTKELKNVVRKSRKIMKMYVAIYPKSDTDRLYLTREKRGRSLFSCNSGVLSEENNLGWYVKNSAEPLIRNVKLAEVIDTKDVISEDEFNRI